MTFLGRERLYALAVFAHTIEVVVGVDRMKKAILPRFPLAGVTVASLSRIGTIRLKPVGCFLPAAVAARVAVPPPLPEPGSVRAAIFR